MLRLLVAFMYILYYKICKNAILFSDNNIRYSATLEIPGCDFDFGK